MEAPQEQPPTPPVRSPLDSLAVRRLLDRGVPLATVIDFAAQLARTEAVKDRSGPIPPA